MIFRRMRNNDFSVTKIKHHKGEQYESHYRHPATSLLTDYCHGCGDETTYEAMWQNAVTRGHTWRPCCIKKECHKLLDEECYCADSGRCEICLDKNISAADAMEDR